MLKNSVSPTGSSAQPDVNIDDLEVEGISALIHQSELSWDATLNPTSYFKIGQVKDELCKENLQLVNENLQKEPRIVELRNQYRIICTTQLAVAQEKLNELDKQKEEVLKLNSPPYLLQRIQEAMNKIEEESENLHKQVLDREIDIGAFLQQYKSLRTAYHRKSLIHLATKTSNI